MKTIEQLKEQVVQAKLSLEGSRRWQVYGADLERESYLFMAEQELNEAIIDLSRECYEVSESL